jgi:GNAT superfamily N-acetyltransferase
VVPSGSFLTTGPQDVSVLGMASVTIGVAAVSDAHQAALLADAKRAEYERYSPVFWRPAENALDRHEPWLKKCLSDESYTSFAARSQSTLIGIAIAAHGVFPPPFRFDPEPSWLVDDFFVLSPDGWRTVGARLLEAVEESAREHGATRTVVLSARRDEPKRTMLAEVGYERGASWWVHPVQALECDPPSLRDTDAVVGPAPPVYDPGGLTALALEMRDPSDVPTFGEWTSASNAILAIVPARSSDPELEDALAAEGYEPASDWFIKKI